MYATLHSAGERFELRFERRLSHPPEKVWRALTELDELRHWFPADPHIDDLAVGGKIRFVFRANEGPTLDGEIRELDPPRLFEFTWSDEILRWELRPDGAGCVLRFTNTFDDREKAAGDGAGWHICLDLLESGLAGRPGLSREQTVERVEQVRAEYVKRFG